MSTNKRVIVCLLAGFAAGLVMFLFGMRPSGVVIGIAIGFTALITKKFRKDRETD